MQRPHGATVPRFVIKTEVLAPNVGSSLQLCGPLTPTDLHREAWREAQSDEVAQLRKMGVGNGHEVDDGRHLLGQRQRVALAQPQGGFEPGGKTEEQTSA